MASHSLQHDTPAISRSNLPPERKGEGVGIFSGGDMLTFLQKGPKLEKVKYEIFLLSDRLVASDQ
jgi:hypothetical protein